MAEPTSLRRLAWPVALLLGTLLVMHVGPVLAPTLLDAAAPAGQVLRALVWVVVVPDVPVVEHGPDFGPDTGPDAGPGGQTAACPTRTPVDALTGQPLGTWQEC